MERPRGASIFIAYGPEMVVGNMSKKLVQANYDPTVLRKNNRYEGRDSAVKDEATASSAK